MSGRSCSRRGFLRSSGAAAAMVWLPGGSKGYTGAEMRARAEEGRIGQEAISKWELDTPALCVDLDAMEANFDRMRETTRRNGIGFRPHVKTHKTPAIAALQIADGAVGICTAKVSEAEAMIEHGVDRVLMTTANVTPFKIRRAMELSRRSGAFVHAVFTEPNARDLSAAAGEAGVTASVVVDVDPGLHRTGIPAGERALALARLVDRLPNLRFRGLLCYDGASQHVEGFEARRARTLETMEAGAETLRLL
ncbi:MAG: DSD1 family PLP-dependent enzyme, partial [Gemmatimonadetes bacterium]|nr:DSD1 family PLP-dependent enzyme [Gemmatimonadota bacterium]NIR78372.1 DSD1 family PLP-dependent enzyme [Gemmatimonadota bacterium]NIT88064.1 DSD1 family PLP-dependent enzyme [Gemmatimonadota bacterium]NIU31896.1 DSD1 family PLP-dependent enzyme [Gemmatimonadota bacterium]NIU35596.1 DSD1 family PLP-dependent enzyme [Gemmatimonadota bacterium]